MSQSSVNGLDVVIGIGCDRQASLAELAALVQSCLAEATVNSNRLVGLASVVLKADEPALRQLAQRLNLPLRCFPVAELEALTPRLATPSEAVFRAIGCHGVAEAAALAWAGPNGALLLPKRRSLHATCALARL
jgi:cobalt-precorrin 5A hydrolase/precorrin-3B C17-methyltransferase